MNLYVLSLFLGEVYDSSTFRTRVYGSFSQKNKNLRVVTSHYQENGYGGGGGRRGGETGVFWYKQCVVRSRVI
jgi:hypothetical protein